MLPRIIEVVWRGPWILVRLCDKMDRENFDRCYLKIYFGEECLAEGIAQHFLDNDDRTEPGNCSIFLDISEIEIPEHLQQPGKLVITGSGEHFEYEITNRTNQEKKTGRFEWDTPTSS